MTAHDRTFQDTAEAGRRAAHDSRQRHARKYVRDAGHLFRWTYPASRDAIQWVELGPGRPALTRYLCHRLYRDLQTAKALPDYFTGKAMRIDELRRTFTAECRVFYQQRASVAAQKGMGGFISGLAAE